VNGLFNRCEFLVAYLIQQYIEPIPIIFYSYLAGANSVFVLNTEMQS